MEQEIISLDGIDVHAVQQSTLENTIGTDVEALITKDSLLRERNRLKKYEQKLKSVRQEITLLENKARSSTKISDKINLKEKIKRLTENEIDSLILDINQIKQRLNALEKGTTHTISLSEKQLDENEKDYLIRTGKITAFGTSVSFRLGDEFDKTASAISSSNEKKDIEIKDTISDDKSCLCVSKTNNVIDDGNEINYQKRLTKWIENRSFLRQNDSYASLNEWEKPHPTIPDAKLNDEFKIPGEIFSLLFNYQKTCVHWLYELYRQKSGGIIGDEMGLGKTIQIISFLASLHHSRLLNGPILIICPATVMKQWCNEFHTWWPPFRTVILHSIGEGMKSNVKLSEDEMENIIMGSASNKFSYDDYIEFNKSKKQLEYKLGLEHLIKKVVDDGHILITTYVGLRIYSDLLLDVMWGYVVLDEGHKIRNPDSHISLVCKQLKTHNRIILSGTPIQNNLVELWSLFDFIIPGKLGTLPVFQQQFVIPINMGGYANATNIQIQTGYKCAVALRDLISPYLLRRIKSDVAKDLPKKHEMVLFCKLTQFQKDKYVEFLNSEDLVKVKNGKKQVLYGIDILRKICNHPDLLERKLNHRKKSYGDPKRSGKMQVVKQLLKLWHEQGHKTLLFTQSRQMLDILEHFIQFKDVDLSVLKYLRMDGTTNVGLRQCLVDKFNNEPYDIFLLTTRVGGLGVNLTGANRIIIFDPDWNPSTDMQARERVWRIGQKREVVIYRLMIEGSIEQKIYHRQIFKQFLTNKILKDPNQKRFFKLGELQDLFTLNGYSGCASEEFMNEINKQTEELKKTSTKTADNFIDVSKFSGVSKLESFYNTKEEEDISKDDDKRLIDGLFTKRKNSESLLYTSTSNGDLLTSNDMISKEATKVADNAIRALHRSRKLTKKFEIGTPTWTGKFGQAGKVKKKCFNRSSPLLKPSENNKEQNI